MKRPADKFTETEFYRERETEILKRLKRTTVPGSNGKTGGGSEYDIADAIYYAGCVAGSLALPVDSDSMCQHLEIIRSNSRDGQWPAIARLLCELYGRANDEVIAQIKSDPALSMQPWALVRIGQSCPPPEWFENPPLPPPARGFVPPE